MPRLPQRQTARLRFGRISAPGARYFVTCCCKNRTRAFAQHPEIRNARGAISSLHDARDIELIAATVMPDHVHLLFTLGPRLSLGQVVAKFKSLTRNKGAAAWRWQDDCFEHRLRPRESAASYAFYIFMNPYRAGLCDLSSWWDGWLCPSAGHLEFLGTLGDGPVPAQWLTEVERIASALSVGK